MIPTVRLDPTHTQVLNVFRAARAFTDDEGNQYPANYLLIATPEELAEKHILPLNAGPRPDESVVRVLHSEWVIGQDQVREVYVTEPIPQTEIDARAAIIQHANALIVIDQKDRQGIRRMREVLLKLAQVTLPSNDPDRITLEAAENAIAAERAKLVPRGDGS